MISSWVKRWIGLALFALLGCCATAQMAPRKVVQISGVVLDNENLAPMPYVNIGVRGSYRGTSSDGNGFFTLVTYAGDHLIFSSVGFRRLTVKIPDTITADRYTLYQSMLKDTLELPLTVIYPWPSKEKFREAFLSLNVPDDDYTIAQKNMQLSELKERARNSKMDAGMNYKNFIQNKVDQLYYAGQYQPNNLLNPFAWAQFLRIWNQQRDAKKREKVREWESYEP